MGREWRPDHDRASEALQPGKPAATDRHGLPSLTHSFTLDWVITARSKEVLEHQVKPVVEAFLAGRGWRLSPTKTVITHIEEGFDFLGQNVRWYKDKLLIKPSRKSIKVLLGKVREVIKVNRPTPAGQLIGQLNPLLRGWAPTITVMW